MNSSTSAFSPPLFSWKVRSCTCQFYEITGKNVTATGEDKLKVVLAVGVIIMPVRCIIYRVPSPKLHILSIETKPST